MENLEWIILLVLCAAAGWLAYYLNRRNRHDCQVLRQEGLHISQIIKQLFVNVQQHRGMMNAFLNGDKSFGVKIEQKESEIERSLTKLDSLYRPALMPKERWDNICSTWQSLLKEAHSLAAEDSFRRHSELIRAIIYLMGDVAERSQITGTHPADAALASALWHKLPMAAEGLGQARALGAGAAAKGHCTSVIRIRLRFLEERIRETMEWVNDDLKRADPVQAATMTKLWETTHKSVSDFLALLEKEIIKTEKLSVDAGHYFGSATQTIDALFSVYDQVSSAMERNLPHQDASS